MQRVIHRLFGYLTVKIEGKKALTAINRLNGEGLSFWGLRKTNEAFFINCSVFTSEKLFAVLSSCGAEYLTVAEKGLPFLLHRYGKRTGLFVGFALSLALIYASSLFVWDIRLSCNGELNEAKARASLHRLGLREGAVLSEIDVHRAELSFLVENPEYSDIAINLEGTVACIELRMRESLPALPEREGVYDIVASRDGVILSVTATNGEPAVEKGDTVKKGDVLINGLVTGKYGAYYAVHAEGEVKATVYRDFSVVIPLQTREKFYTGRTETKTSVKILGKSFDFFLSELSPYEKCDVSASSKKLSLFGSVLLPLRVETLSYREYELRELSLSESEALQRAENALKAWAERNINGKLISAESEYRLDKEHQVLIYKARIEAEEEIGLKKEPDLSSVPLPNAENQKAQ